MQLLNSFIEYKNFCLKGKPTLPKDRDLEKLSSKISITIAFRMQNIAAKNVTGMKKRAFTSHVASEKALFNRIPHMQLPNSWVKNARGIQNLYRLSIKASVIINR